MDFPDKMTQHGLGYFKIGDDTVFHGSYGNDIAGSTAQHQLGLFPDGQDSIIALSVLAYRHHRRFAQNNTFAFNVDQGVGRP